MEGFVFIYIFSAYTLATKAVGIIVFENTIQLYCMLLMISFSCYLTCLVRACVCTLPKEMDILHTHLHTLRHDCHVQLDFHV